MTLPGQSYTLSQFTVRHLCSSYLTELEGCVSESTYNSHSALVDKFSTHCVERDISAKEIDTECAARFIKSVVHQHTNDTVRGWIASLANLLAFARADDPEVIKGRIGLTLRNQYGIIIDDLSPGTQLNERTIAQIRDFTEYLRRSRFGTRAHAVTELIVGTHGRPGIVLTTDRDDLDLDTDTIVLAVSDTHVVGKESIITKRDVQLPPVARDALNTYCGHERTTPTTGNALFTSSDGRINPSTLYRDIRDRSEEVLNPTTTSTEQPHASGSKDQSPKQLTPEQLWKYSFTTMEI